VALHKHMAMSKPGSDLMSKSYKVAVKTPGDVNWASNGLRFPTREAAAEYGQDLFMRWTSVQEWEVQESDEEPNR
jgi:hypothetical protein